MREEILEKEIKRKIEDFTDVEAWRLGHKLALEVYKISKSYPDDEIYALTSQTRRVVVSITSNIAEGMGRFSYRDRIRFFYISRGSLYEVQNLILLAYDLSYMNQDDFLTLQKKIDEARRVLNGFINSTERLMELQ